MFYNLGIYLFRLVTWVASWVDPKARAFVKGRNNLFRHLNEVFKTSSSPLIWVHCASVGEFEQGRPVMEALKKSMPQFKILLTFFSPSGYELRKNYTGADWVFYLPYDTPANARRFVEITMPALAIFVKYEFWLNYSLELKRRKIYQLSISSIFRPTQVFFKRYGSVFRRILKNFDHFFVQNQESLNLLNKIAITRVTVVGDTRFDRVHQITQQAGDIPIAAKFKGTERTFVIGSCWPEDLDVLAPFINENQTHLKFILAPHEISESFIREIQEALHVKSVRFSQAGDNVDEYSVLIIDNIGMLSRLYRYGEFAYVGGAFGKGLHNILEAACYGVPIFFGDRNYQKFLEANDLIMRGGAFEISSYSDLKSKYESMINRPENFLLACEVTRSYVNENLGATRKIVDYCAKLLQTA